MSFYTEKQQQLIAEAEPILAAEPAQGFLEVIWLAA